MAELPAAWSGLSGMRGDWAGRAGIGPLASRGDADRIRMVDPRVGTGEVGPFIVWLGHASFLIRWKGVSMVIDPVFARWIGFARRQVPRPSVERLGLIDVVLVTHGHMDHLADRGIASVAPRRIILPERTERFLPRGLRQSGKVATIRLDQVQTIGPLTIRAVSARHGGWRYPWQRGHQAFGYLIEDGERAIYAAGDTAYGSHFREIGRSSDIRWALLPIGAYAPRWLLRSRHLDPVEAVQAWRDLGAAAIVHPGHFGTYRLSLEPMDEPLPWFARLAEAAGMEWCLRIGFS